MAGFFGYAQKKKTKAQLLKEKTSVLGKIHDAEILLKETSGKKISTLGELRALNELIRVKRVYTKNLQNQMGYISEEMVELEDILTAMQNDLDSLKEEYAEMIFAASKSNASMNKMMLIFTSQSYYQLSMRMSFLTQLAEARKTQVYQIGKVRESLEKQREKLSGKKEDLDKALAEVQKQKKELDDLKRDQKRVYAGLAKQEDDIKRRVRKLQKDQQKIEQAIKEIIRDEQEKARVKEKNGWKTTEKDALINKDFASNKGRLPWPVTRCFVSRKFGQQPHPRYPGLKVNNIGVGLQTQTSASVRAVYDGKVVSVMDIPGTGKTVMIKHGDYFTVYGRLSVVNVKTGQFVNAKAIIGKVGKLYDGTPELDFQVWKGQSNLNPVSWLYK